MRVCFMIDTWSSPPESIGGGGVVVWEVIRHLVTTYNCNIDLIAKNQPNADGTSPPRIETYYNGKLRVIRVGPYLSESILGKAIYCIVAIPAVIQGHYDLINAVAFAAGFPAWVVRQLTKVPVIFSVHGIGIKAMDELYNGKAWLMSYLETLLLFKLKYDHQISVSRDILDYPNQTRNITIIPNGVNLSDFDAVECEKSDHFQIIFVGRFYPQKGLFYLMEAMVQVVQHTPSAKLLMVGGGEQEQTLRSRISELNLDKTVTFVGFLTGEDKIKAFKASHLFVLPSVYEGQPLTLLEAWSAGLPVVVTTVGANSDFVEEGVNGYLVEPKRSDLLAKAIIRAIENPSLAELGQCGYEIAKSHSWEQVTEQTYQVYLEVLKRDGHLI